MLSRGITLGTVLFNCKGKFHNLDSTTRFIFMYADPYWKSGCKHTYSCWGSKPVAGRAGIHGITLWLVFTHFTFWKVSRNGIVCEWGHGDMNWLQRNGVLLFSFRSGRRKHCFQLLHLESLMLLYWSTLYILTWGWKEEESALSHLLKHMVLHLNSQPILSLYLDCNLTKAAGTLTVETKSWSNLIL